MIETDNETLAEPRGQGRPRRRFEIADRLEAKPLKRDNGFRGKTQAGDGNIGKGSLGLSRSNYVPGLVLGRRRKAGHAPRGTGGIGKRSARAIPNSLKTGNQIVQQCFFTTEQMRAAGDIDP